MLFWRTIGLHTCPHLNLKFPLLLIKCHFVMKYFRIRARHRRHQAEVGGPIRQVGTHTNDSTSIAHSLCTSVCVYVYVYVLRRDRAQTPFSSDYFTQNIPDCAEYGPRCLSRYRESLWAGRSGGSNSDGVDIFRTQPDRTWTLSSLLYNAYRVSFMRE